MRRPIIFAGLAGVLFLTVTACSLEWLSGANGGLSARGKTSTAITILNNTLEAKYNMTLTALSVVEYTTRTAVYAQETIVPQQVVQTPAPAGQMVVYLAAPEGGPGPIGPIGCGNYLVPVVRGDIPPTETQRQIAYALTDLFSIKDQFYGQSGLYDALYQSNLAVQSVEIDGTGHATVNLTGSYLLGGECDDPLFRAQIEYTAQQFPGVSSVSVFINGAPIENILSGR
jgi:hypothetical protein